MRMTRRLFAELEQRLSVTPLCWNRLGHFCARLSMATNAVALPELCGEKFPGELRRMLGRNAIDLCREIGEGDVFLAPDFFRDSRRQKLPDLIRKTGTRSIAIFHDGATERLGMHAARYNRAIVITSSFIVGSASRY